MTDVPQDNLASLEPAAMPVEEGRSAPAAVAEAPAEKAASEAATARGRSFALTFVGTTILLYGAVVAINMVGNSKGLFPSKVNPSMCERAWKTRRVDEAIHRHRPPKVVVFGSSRTMQIQPPYLEAVTGKGPAFNYGVSAGEAIDWLSQLKYLISRGAAPEVIVLGIDDLSFGTLFNRYQIQLATHWGLFNEVPLRERMLIGRDALLQVDFDETRKSLVTLFNPPQPPRGGSSPIAVERKAPASGPATAPATRSVAAKRSSKAVRRRSRQPTRVFLADGYLIYIDKVLAKARNEYGLSRRVTGQARGWREIVDREPHPLEALAPSERKIEFLREFLDLAKAHHIEVRAVHLPLHPEFEKIALTPEMQEIRDRVGRIVAAECAARQFVYRDLRKPESYGGAGEEWWDAFHQTPENLRRMINVLFDLPPAKVVRKVATDEEILRKPPKVTDLSTW